MINLSNAKKKNNFINKSLNNDFIKSHISKPSNDFYRNNSNNKNPFNKTNNI
jgi:hypothetical protein